MKHYHNVELKGNDAIRFRGYLADMHIKYESSAAGYGYTHFECLMTDAEAKAADEFLSTL